MNASGFCLAAGLLVTAPLLGGVGAAMHLRLVRSQPSSDAIAEVAPREIRLTFSLTPEIALSSVTLRGPDSSVVATAKPILDPDQVTVVARVTGTMRPGLHAVQWKTASSDGHPVTGTFRFTVAAGAAAPVRERTGTGSGASAAIRSRDYSTR